MPTLPDKSFRVDLAYNYELNYVFSTIYRAAQACGFNIEGADNNNYMLYLTKGMSMFTWGEKLYVAAGILPDGRTGVTIVSQPKLGTEFGARKQNQKNVELFVTMLNQMLGQMYQP